MKTATPSVAAHGLPFSFEVSGGIHQTISNALAEADSLGSVRGNKSAVKLKDISPSTT